ncbi:MAG: ATP-grasp domain-containing protein [Candidatus Altiarchaeota archaeon]|nr:ATP-grasp domain-containing protein [Candidatus Altiarchaeota archaeon]
MNEEIGVVGINSRAVAASAKRLNYVVYLVDYFRDVDTQKVADFHYPLQRDPLKPDLENEYSQDELVNHTIDELDGRVDSLLITSDLGCNPKLVKELEGYFRILGNSSKQIAGAKNWGVLKKIFDEIGMLYPKTIVARSFRDLLNAVDKLGYPLVVKSLVKGTEIAPALISDGDDLRVYQDMKIDHDVLVQEYIKGDGISSSVLSDGGEAVTLSVNKQLVGVKEFGTEDEFMYCGNIVPLDSLADDDIIAAQSSRLISRLKLTGSNGVDYLVSDDGVYFMEVNTRFQDTLECVEKYRGINLVEEHLKAIEGDLLMPKEESSRCFGKGILYAHRNLLVKDLTGLEDVGDIPFPRSRVRESEPLCSIYSEGRDNEEAFLGLLNRVEMVRDKFLY